MIARGQRPAWLLAVAVLACALPGLPGSGGEARLPAALAGVSAELPVPRDLEARSGELRRVPLFWTPLLTGDVAGYRIERSDDGARFEPIATVVGRFAASHLDKGRGQEVLGDGVTYRYRMRAVDSRGRPAREASDPVAATTAPPPPPPQALRAFNHLPRRVALSWEASPDPSVAGYVVSRSPSAGGPFGPIARIRGRFVTHYLDEGLGDLRFFYYQVAAVSSAGAAGGPSEPAVAVTKAEPLPPAGLRVVEQWLGGNRVAWEPNVEPDVTGYRVLRYRAGKPSPETVAELSPDETATDDISVGAGEPVSYAVVAFDADGLESLLTDPVDVVSADYGLSAEPRDGAVHLHWDPRVAQGFAGARVQREGWLGMRELARVPSEGFVDRDVRPGRSYRYVVVLERPDGRLAPPSRPLEVSVPAQEGGAAAGVAAEPPRAPPTTGSR